MTSPETIEVNLPPFHVLVTTAAQVVAQSGTMSGGIPSASIALHTTVLEFSTRKAADLAVNRINLRVGRKLHDAIIQEAVPLY